MSVCSLKTQMSREKRQLIEEMQQIETKLLETEIKNERLVREKRAAETELQRLSQTQPTESERYQSVVSDLNSRLRRLERERDESCSKLET